MKTQLISLEHILEDTRFQFRESSLGKNVAELKRLMLDGIEIEPVTLWKQEHGYFILDGFQRVEAARKVLGEDGSIKAKIAAFPQDDYRSAFLYAISANQKHGAQLEKPDRANMAKRLLLEFPKFSNVQIAKRCGLAESTVRGYRNEMPEAQSDTRLGTDGREISVPKATLKGNTQTNENAEASSAETHTQDAMKLNCSETGQSKTKVKEDPQELGTASELTLVDVLPFQSHEHPELQALGIHPQEISGDLADLIEELDQLRSYLEGFLLRTDIAKEDVEQVQAIQEAVVRLHGWKKSVFVSEDSEATLRA
jgi:hypothetical protein